MNISLIGMMGSGKSTIGKYLLKNLEGYSFFDTDDIIVSKEKCSINEIFKNKGEEYFRNVESSVLENILNNDNQIISTGGGIVLRAFNIKLLKEKSIIIYLEADSETLYSRVKNNNERPLLNVDNMREKIDSLLKKRVFLYEAAHIKINTVNKTPEIIVNEILEKIKYGKN